MVWYVDIYLQRVLLLQNSLDILVRSLSHFALLNVNIFDTRPSLKNMLRPKYMSRLFLCSTLVVLIFYAFVLDKRSESHEEVSYAAPLVTRDLAPDKYLNGHRPSNRSHWEKRDGEYNHWSSVNGQACRISDCLR
jgi:hypothetical protein